MCYLIIFIIPSVKVNAQGYRQCIMEVALKPWTENHFGGILWTIQQISEQFHKSQANQEWLKKFTNSPDAMPKLLIEGKYLYLFISQNILLYFVHLISQTSHCRIVGFLVVSRPWSRHILYYELSKSNFSNWFYVLFISYTSSSAEPV